MTDKPTVEVLTEDEGPDFSIPAYDAGDPEQVHLARRKAGRKAKEKSDFIARVMGDKAGRRWIWGILEFCHVFQTTRVLGDPHETYFREGERNVGLKVLADVMRAAPEQWVTMLEENKTNG